MRRLLVVLASVGLVATVFAQKPSPIPRPSSPTVELGWSVWDVDGSENKFRQYATPAKGIFLRKLHAPIPFAFAGNAGSLTLQGINEDDYRMDGGFAFLFGTTSAEGSLFRHRFFDATPFLVSRSERTVREGFVKHLLTPDFAVSLRYRMDEQDHFFEAPRLPLRQRTRYWDAAAEGKVGMGQLSLSYTDFRYFDRTDIRPDTSVKRWQTRYLWQPLTNFGVEGTFARLSLKQPGLPSNDLEVLSLSGDWTITPVTDFAVTLRRDKLDLPVVRNARVRERRIGVTNLSHRWRGWTVQLGFRQQEGERIRRNQDFVDVPRWRTWDFRLSGRISPRWRLTLRGSTQHLTHLPTMGTVDPRPLFWDDRRFAQLKLEGGSPTLNGYLTLTHRRWNNDARAVALTTNAIVVGGNWQVRRQLSLVAEYAYEAWRGKSEMVAFPTLDNFVPNSRATTFGLSWVVDKRTFFSANYTEFVTANDNPLLLRDGNYRGRFLTAVCRYRFPAGYELTLTVAPWRYRDRMVDWMDYDATIVMLSGSARF